MSEGPRILIDFSNVAMACWFPALRAAEVDPKYEVHAVFKNNLASKVVTIQEGIGLEVGGPNTAMCLDSHADWKYAIFPEYKAGRKKDYDPRPEAEAFLRERFPTMLWAKAPGYEADDVLATLAVRFAGLGATVTIVSGDFDLWQLLGPKVRIFLPSKKKFVDEAMVAEEFGVREPAQIRLCKALWGDTSDALPNCAPRMQKQLLPIVAESTTLDDVLSKAAGRVNETCMGHLRKNLDQVLKNWYLVQLHTDAKLEWQ